MKKSYINSKRVGKYWFSLKRKSAISLDTTKREREKERERKRERDTVGIKRGIKATDRYRIIEKIACGRGREECTV